MIEKPLDIILRVMEKEQALQEQKLQKIYPYLKRELFKLKQIDGKIEWFKEKLKEIEKEKLKELNRFGDLLDTCGITSFSDEDGFTVLPDNKYNLEVSSVPLFLKWLKENKSPEEVVEFFKDAFKLSNLKKFVEKEINKQELNNEIIPHVDGIKIKEIGFRKLKTEKRKVKNDKRTKKGKSSKRNKFFI